MGRGVSRRHGVPQDGTGCLKRVGLFPDGTLIWQVGSPVPASEIEHQRAGLACEPHRDMTLITLLDQGEEGGLQVYTCTCICTCTCTCTCVCIHNKGTRHLPR